MYYCEEEMIRQANRLAAVRGATGMVAPVYADVACAERASGASNSKQ